MRDETRKTIILFVTILIFSTIYFVPKLQEQNDFYTILLMMIIIFSVSLLQTLKLQTWTKEKKTRDYLYVYYLFILFTIALFMYIIFILISYNINLEYLKFNFLDKITEKFQNFRNL